MTTLHAGAATDTGMVREKNQDRFLVTPYLYAVADGMGGHLGGETASAMTVDTLSVQLTEPLEHPDELDSAIQLANAAVFQRSQNDASVKGMGTTVTAIAVVHDQEGERLAVINVGDSRCYLFRSNELQQLTNDHSLVEELLRTGQLTPDEAEDHPRRNMLTRALGVDATVETDLFDVIPARGDRYVLCSDGLVRELTDDQIASVLRRLADPEEAAKDLVQKAKEAGGADNITVVIVDVTDDDGVGREPQPQAAHLRPNQTAAVASSSKSQKPAAAASGAHADDSLFITFRVIVFLVVLLGVLAAGYVGVSAYANNAYYVGAKGDKVAIYKGRPGGVLWFKPSLVRVTSLKLSDIPDSRQDDVKEGNAVDSKVAAENYVSALKEEKDSFSSTTTTPDSVTTTTPTSAVTTP